MCKKRKQRLHSQPCGTVGPERGRRKGGQKAVLVLDGGLCLCVCVCVCVCVFAPSNEEAAGRERQDLVSLPRQSLRYKYRFTAKPARELFCPFRQEHGICENKHENAQKNVWVR